MFGVFDWAGNRLFDCKTFADFDDAWEYIYIMFPDDEELYGDLFAVPLDEMNVRNYSF